MAEAINEAVENLQSADLKQPSEKPMEKLPTIIMQTSFTIPEHLYYK